MLWVINAPGAVVLTRLRVTVCISVLVAGCGSPVEGRMVSMREILKNARVAVEREQDLSKLRE